jgi:hypothetical protein
MVTRHLPCLRLQRNLLANARAIAVGESVLLLRSGSTLSVLIARRSGLAIMYDRRE